MTYAGIYTGSSTRIACIYTYQGMAKILAHALAAIRAPGAIGEATASEMDRKVRLDDFGRG